MFGTTYLATYMWPLTIVSITASRTWPRMSWMESRAATPGVADEHVDAAVEEVQRLGHGRLDLALVADVAGQRDHAPVAVLDRRDRLVEHLGRGERVDVGDRFGDVEGGDVRARVGERLGVAEALALRRPGDQDVLALESAQHCGHGRFLPFAGAVAASPAPPWSATRRGRHTYRPYGGRSRARVLRVTPYRR